MTTSSPSRLPYFASLLCPALLLSPAGAAETRTFQVLVDGKSAGQYYLTVAPGNDGKTVVTSRAAVRVRFGFYTYTYSYQGTEIWAGDRLERSQSNSVERGKKATVSAVMQGDRATITVNGRTRTDGACSWTTTHWRLPPRPDQVLAVLDVDAGKRLTARLQFIETVRLNLGGQVKTCTHYRVTGSDQAEVWYDESKRLVRQQTVEDGHRTELRLTGIR